jgi:hypothetical protein
MELAGTRDTVARALAAAAQATADAASGDAAQAIADAAAAQATANAAIPSAEKAAANGVATLDASALIPLSQIPNLTGDRWVGSGPITSGVTVLTNTNGEAGTWANISAAWASGSPVALLAGLAAGNCLYFGCDSPSWTALGHTVGTAMVLGAGSVAVEVWTGSVWTAQPCMETERGGAHAMRANSIFQATGASNVRFGTSGSGSTSKILDGNLKYWIRVRVAVAITIAPTASGGYLVKDGTLIGSDGVPEYFGSARPKLPVMLHRSLWTIQAGNAPGSVNVSVSTNITQGSVNNQFNDGAVNGLTVWARIGESLDTSIPPELQVLWIPNTAAVAPNDVIQWRLYYLKAVEDVSVLDGTAADILATVLATAPGVAKRLTETEILIPVDSHLSDSYLVLKLERDARLGNLNDTYNNSAILTHTYLVGRAWRS